MSSRPRRASSQPAAIAANVRRGLESFIAAGNEAVITQMLGAEATGRSENSLVDKLVQVMHVNSLNHEMLLARFFDSSVLAAYCNRLGQSDKGSAATLAARIAKEWSRPDFGEVEASAASTAGSSSVAAEASGAATPKAWTAPTWFELQTDSDDDEEEAQRKKRMKAELRRAKQQHQQAGRQADNVEDEQKDSSVIRSQASSSAAEPVPDAKRRKLDAEDTASALSRAAYQDSNEVEDELPAAFNKAHYGVDGLNGRFEASDAIEFFAGGEDGGGGKFEDIESRDIAKNAAALIDAMRTHGGLRSGATCLDVGAGTGLMLKPLSAAVSGSGKDANSGADGSHGRVIALDVSAKFCSFLNRRVLREKLSNVRVVHCTPKSTTLPVGTSASFACLLDVYHHIEYPSTFMRSVRDALCDHGRVFVCDFHRDPDRVKSMPPSWALEHIRADQATFRAEIEEAGFRLVASPELPGLQENYIMVFEKK